MRALPAAPRRSCHARVSKGGSTSSAGLVALDLKCGRSQMPIICSVSWKRRALPRSLAISFMVLASRSVTTAPSWSTWSASMTSGPFSAMMPRRMWRSLDSPRRPPYQASSARRAVLQAGSKTRRNVRRLERVRRMATRLWWMRSVSVWRRSVPSSDSRADWAQSGPGAHLRGEGLQGAGRLSSSTSSSPMSFKRKVRADMARTRCSTMPAVGSGKCSGAAISPRVPAAVERWCCPAPGRRFGRHPEASRTHRLRGRRPSAVTISGGDPAPSIAWADARGDHRRGRPRMA